jgi:glycosyltransferase involved in cell wall biosynthesis
MEYRKILIATSSTFNPYTGTGILLSNLFRGWPKDKMAIVHSDDFYHDRNICSNVYKLGNEEFRWIWLLNSFMKKVVGNRLSKSKYSFNDGSGSGSGVTVNSLLRLLYDQMNRLLGGQEVYLERIPSDGLLDWIHGFEPELLYCHVSSLMNIRFVRRLKNLLQIALCVHIMDDWLNVRYRSGIFGNKLRSDYLKEFQGILTESSLRMCIGQKMCDFYGNMFGVSFVPVSNVVDPALWMTRRDNGNRHDIFSIVYAGTINTKNVCNLKLISRVIEELHTEKKNCRLRISTFQPRAKLYRAILERKPSVIVSEVPQDDQGMARLLQDADLLYLPVDFSKVSIERMRFSIFAKLPAYMMSGTPILAYGPPEVASIEYAQKEKWAYVVGREDKSALKKAIMELVENPDLRERLGKRAQKIGVRDFDANKLRPEFHKALAMAARQGI